MTSTARNVLETARAPRGGRLGPWLVLLLCAPARGATDGDAPPSLERALDASETVERRLAAIEELSASPGAAASTALARLLTPREPSRLQEAAARALARSAGHGGPARLVEAWRSLSPRVRASAVDALLSSPEGALAFLQGFPDGRPAAADIPARSAYLLRNHPDPTARREARKALSPPRRQGAAARAAALGEISPRVLEGGGDAEKGMAHFDRHCAACHTLDGKGKELGTDLSGVGLLGAEALLAEIIDPNRAVEDRYTSYALVTKEGAAESGIIASETDSSLVLKRNGGSAVVPRAEVLSLVSQGASLMPEGLESALSIAELRDLVAFLAPRSAHRALDLRIAANADSSQGLFTSPVNHREALPFESFSLEAGGVPFRILHPASTEGRNIIALRGGPDTPGILARGYPESAEIPCGFAPRRLHFLGGVGGWGHPETREEVPVLTVTLHYASGGSESVVWRNGLRSRARRRSPRSRARSRRSA